MGKRIMRYALRIALWAYTVWILCTAAWDLLMPEPAHSPAFSAPALWVSAALPLGSTVCGAAALVKRGRCAGLLTASGLMGIAGYPAPPTAYRVYIRDAFFLFNICTLLPVFALLLGILAAGYRCFSVGRR